MTATPEEAVQMAVNFAVIEMLLRPEYDMNFIEECVEDAQARTGLQVDPEVVAQQVNAALAELAENALAAIPAAERDRRA